MSEQKKDFETRTKEFLDHLEETMNHACDYPVDFVFESIRGTGLMVKEHFFHKPRMSRLYDDECRRAAKLAWPLLAGIVGILALAKYRCDQRNQTQGNQAEATSKFVVVERGDISPAKFMWEKMVKRFKEK